LPEVRRATPGDERLWRSAAASILSDEQTEGTFASDIELAAALSDARCYLFLSLEGEKPVGLLSAYVFPDVVSGGKLAYLYDIEVLRSYRRGPVGTSLLSALLASCRADGVKLVWAGTDCENVAARRTFERTGAEAEGDQYVEYEWDLD
jgi:ribosomal protein S18 acetylase RimI-like enzyme